MLQLRPDRDIARDDVYRRWAVGFNELRSRVRATDVLELEWILHRGVHDHAGRKHTGGGGRDHNSRSELCPTMRQYQRHKMCYFRSSQTLLACTATRLAFYLEQALILGFDSTVKASGNSSLKFTIPSQSGSNAGGGFH